MRLTTHSLAGLLPPQERLTLIRRAREPKTRRVLKRAVDTNVTLAKRRIEWAVTNAKGTTFREFCEMAKIRAQMKDPAIKRMAQSIYENHWGFPAFAVKTPGKNQ
jgi:hypothetical protein